MEHERPKIDRLDSLSSHAKLLNATVRPYLLDTPIPIDRVIETINTEDKASLDESALQRSMIELEDAGIRIYRAKRGSPDEAIFAVKRTTPDAQNIIVFDDVLQVGGTLIRLNNRERGIIRAFSGSPHDVATERYINGRYSNGEDLLMHISRKVNESHPITGEIFIALGTGIDQFYGIDPNFTLEFKQGYQRLSPQMLSVLEYLAHVNDRDEIHDELSKIAAIAGDVRAMRIVHNFNTLQRRMTQRIASTREQVVYAQLREKDDSELSKASAIVAYRPSRLYDKPPELGAQVELRQVDLDQIIDEPLTEAVEHQEKLKYGQHHFAVMSLVLGVWQEEIEDTFRDHPIEMYRFIDEKTLNKLRNSLPSDIVEKMMGRSNTLTQEEMRFTKEFLRKTIQEFMRFFQEEIRDKPFEREEFKAWKEKFQNNAIELYDLDNAILLETILHLSDCDTALFRRIVNSDYSLIEVSDSLNDDHLRYAAVCFQKPGYDSGQGVPLKNIGKVYPLEVRLPKLRRHIKSSANQFSNVPVDQLARIIHESITRENVRFSVRYDDWPVVDEIIEQIIFNKINVDDVSD